MLYAIVVGEQNGMVDGIKLREALDEQLNQPLPGRAGPQGEADASTLATWGTGRDAYRAQQAMMNLV